MTPSRKRPASGSRRLRATARIASASATAARTWPIRRPQATVGVTVLLVRSKSAVPSSSSSLRTCTESVGWLMPQASAARPKCPCSTTASKYLRSRRFIGSARPPSFARQAVRARAVHLELVPEPLREMAVVIDDDQLVGHEQDEVALVAGAGEPLLDRLELEREVVA